MKNITEYLQQQSKQILADIETLVRIETPSKNAVGVNQLQDVIQKWMSDLGATIKRVEIYSMRTFKGKTIRGLFCLGMLIRYIRLARGKIIGK
jgi:acetylornithine deacetylase/succinyl-diaminopimelate desuccinylase-like protein